MVLCAGMEYRLGQWGLKTASYLSSKKLITKISRSNKFMVQVVEYVLINSFRWEEVQGYNSKILIRKMKKTVVTSGVNAVIWTCIFKFNLAD